MSKNFAHLECIFSWNCRFLGVRCIDHDERFERRESAENICDMLNVWKLIVADVEEIEEWKSLEYFQLHQLRMCADQRVKMVKTKTQGAPCVFVFTIFTR